MQIECLFHNLSGFNFTTHHFDTDMFVGSELLSSAVTKTPRDTPWPNRVASTVGAQMPEAYDGENLFMAEALIQGNGNAMKLAVLRMLLFRISNNLAFLGRGARNALETFRKIAAPSHDWSPVISAMGGSTSESIIEKVFEAAVIHN